MRHLLCVLLLLLLTPAPAAAQTRFWFAAGTAAPVTSVTPGTGWTMTTGAVRRLLRRPKGTESMATGTGIGGGQNLTADALDRQFVSGHLPAGITFSTAVTVRAQLLMRESSSNDQVMGCVLGIRVVDDAGTTVRATLLNVARWGNTAELASAPSAFTDRSCANADALTCSSGCTGGQYVTVANDRIVVEIGYHIVSGTSVSASARYGDAVADAPISESSTTDAAGWIEFSNTFDLTEPTPTPTATPTPTPTPTATPPTTGLGMSVLAVVPNAANANLALFRGGLDPVNPLRYSRAGATHFPGMNLIGELLLDAQPKCAGGPSKNRACANNADCPSSTCGPFTSWGSILLDPAGNPQPRPWTGTLFDALVAPPSRCVGGDGDGNRCATSAMCGGGACRTQRIPILTYTDDAGNPGCTLTLEAECESVATSAPDATCNNQTQRLRLLYGGAQPTTTGVCSGAETMNDTVCGGSCTYHCFGGANPGVTCAADSTCTGGGTCGYSIADCLPGRPNETTYVTACALDANEDSPCTMGAACHCVRECDERNSNESQCQPNEFRALSVALDTPLALVMRQDNGADPGATACYLRSGFVEGGQTKVYPRGGHTATVGICTGGSVLDQGGRQTLACATNADCACRASPYEICTGVNTPEPSSPKRYGVTCAAACAAGTCDASARITPTRLMVGDADATTTQGFSVALGGLWNTTGFALTNWRYETLPVDGNGVTQQWPVEPNGTLCGTSSHYPCLRGDGTLANEPDAVTSYVGNANASTDTWTEEFTFANPATTDTPVMATIELAAQDTELTTDGAGLRVWGRNAAGTLAGRYVGGTCHTSCSDTGTACFSDGECEGCTGGEGCTMFDLDDNDPDDGASAHYLPAPTLVLPASPSGALWNTCVGGSNPGTSCQTSAQCTGGGTCATASDLGVRFSKLQAHGASASVRVTYATANLLYPAADPPMPAIFPDQKQCRSGSNNLAHCTVDSECPGGTCAGDGRKVLCFTGDSTYHNKDLAEHLAAYTLEATDIYRESRGASSLGDIETGFPQLLLGQTGGGMPVDLRLGELGHPCDIIFVGEGLNALHAPTGTAGMADPAGPTTKVCASGANDGFLCTAASECPGGTCEAWGGIGQAGFCEDWNEDTGYGARQGAPCMCAESATWDTAVTANVTLSSLCLIKNVHFGTGAWEETCSCTPASSECSVGGTLPFGTNATTTTCNGAGRCVSTTSDFRASADAGARDWVTPGCAPGTAIGCPGVCITQTPVARLLLSAERIQAIADAAPSHPLVVWNTIPYSSRWWRNRPEVDAWNAGLLAWAIAGGHAFVDLAGIFATHCDDLYRSHGAGESSCLTNDGIHWKAVAQDLAGSTWVTCASNGNDTAFCRGGTNSGGICTASSECPNGTCAKSHDGHCASGVCDAGKVGDVCTRDEQCSYWWCPLP